MYSSLSKIPFFFFTEKHEKSLGKVLPEGDAIPAFCFLLKSLSKDKVSLQKYMTSRFSCTVRYTKKFDRNDGSQSRNFCSFHAAIFIPQLFKNLPATNWTVYKMYLLEENFSILRSCTLCIQSKAPYKYLSNKKK